MILSVCAGTQRDVAFADKQGREVVFESRDNNGGQWFGPSDFSIGCVQKC